MEGRGGAFGSILPSTIQAAFVMQQYRHLKACWLLFGVQLLCECVHYVRKCGAFNKRFLSFLCLKNAVAALFVHLCSIPTFGREDGASGWHLYHLLGLLVTSVESCEDGLARTGQGARTVAVRLTTGDAKPSLTFLGSEQIVFSEQVGLGLQGVPEIAPP